MNYLLFFRVLTGLLPFFAFAGPAQAQAQEEWPQVAGVYQNSMPGYDPLAEILNARGTHFPELSTFLWYKAFGANPETVRDLFAHAAEKQVIVQIGFEPWSLHYDAQGTRTMIGLNLEDLERAFDRAPTELARVVQGVSAGQAVTFEVPLKVRKTLQLEGGRREFEVDLNQTFVDVVKWAVFLAKDGRPAYLRPLSEMNMGESGSWSFGRDPANTPKAFARVWRQMRGIFAEAGATNVRFLFIVGAAWSDGVRRPDLIRETLSRIPPGSVDGLGFNPYSRSADGNADPRSFKRIVEGWMSVFDEFEGYRSKPLAVAEMGVFNSTDAQGAKWIRDAFAYASGRGAGPDQERSARFAGKQFCMMTYYNAGDASSRDFRVQPGTEAYQALRAGIRGFTGTRGPD